MLQAAVRQVAPTLTLPYEGQATYNALHILFARAMGTAYCHVELQSGPALEISQTAEGWAVFRAGGAEYPGFDTLAARLAAAGYNARNGVKWHGWPVVHFAIPTGREVESFPRLAAIIAST